MNAKLSADWRVGVEPSGGLLLLILQPVFPVSQLMCTYVCRGPLWGACFAVKDNIDVRGFQSTAACPAFSYTAKESAPVVRALLQAGCVCIGKTNMDQFAAGLNGTRSPYGVPINSVDVRVIPGGSSSGSGVAVGSGAVSFALGTDTAGSGRVPAGLNNVVGIKPTVGMLSTQGVVSHICMNRWFSICCQCIS